MKSNRSKIMAITMVMLLSICFSVTTIGIRSLFLYITNTSAMIFSPYFAIHSVSCGINVINSSTTSMEIIKGKIAFTNFCMDTPDTDIPVNRQVPNGGVTNPIHTAVHITIPNCSVLIPSCWITGRNIGIVIRRIGVASMIHPMISKITRIIRRMTYLLSEIPSSPCTSICGSCA